MKFVAVHHNGIISIHTQKGEKSIINRTLREIKKILSSNTDINYEIVVNKIDKPDYRYRFYQ